MNQNGILIDIEFESTTHPQRLRVNKSSTKNQLGLLIDKESEWTTHRKSIREEYSSTKN